MATDADRPDGAGGDVSPRNKASMEKTIQRSLGSIDNTLESMDIRADPDAQATVTDFLDFTEYLPSDMMRSLTLIGKLDQTYHEASANVHKLTKTWSQLPNLPADSRPAAVQLRADISENLSRAVSSRIYSHAEATRMAGNVNRHHARAKLILSKLQTMLDNYPPPEELKSPVASSKSPQAVRAKAPARVGEDGQRIRRQRVPRITVPGEVLAPYEIDLNIYSDDSDVSSSSEAPDTPRRRTPARSTPGGTSRIKLVNRDRKLLKIPKTPKPPSSRPPRPVTVNFPGATPSAPIVLQPPPDNAVPGSSDAPWLQLTQYELARLRKRMKKNAVWTPSDTMIARELKNLGRGPDAYRAAKKKAEEEGKPFDNAVPKPVVDGESGEKLLPEGAISVDALADDLPVSNKGMKLNEAKKLKREAMAKQAAEEAEESERKFAEAARLLMGGSTFSAPTPDVASAKPNGRARPSGGKSTRPSNKRKRDTAEEESEKPESQDTPSARPQIKRTKTETPVPPPQLNPPANSQPRSETPIPPPMLTPGGASAPQSTTPVPIPIPPLSQESAAAAKTSASPTGTATSANGGLPTTLPTKLPTDAQTPIPPPVVETRKSTTPILPPTQPKRETRQEAAKKQQQQQQQPQAAPTEAPPATAATVKQSASRGATPVLETPAQTSRRTESRGKAMSQEPAQSLAADRPRRASTARNTPAPEAPRQKRKRPAPGIVSTTNSGSNSAVGKRKAAPRKKAPTHKKDKDKGEPEMEEIDDEGNPIDPNEPRYCVCNNVSFGTMIQCDNGENCQLEWFHLPCVGLGQSLPARTTKWYCPECRVKLGIGEKGEVNARGVKT